MDSSRDRALQRQEDKRLRTELLATSILNPKERQLRAVTQDFQNQSTSFQKSIYSTEQEQEQARKKIVLENRDDMRQRFLMDKQRKEQTVIDGQVAWEQNMRKTQSRLKAEQNFTNSQIIKSKDLETRRRQAESASILSSIDDFESTLDRHKMTSASTKRPSLVSDIVTDASEADLPDQLQSKLHLQKIEQMLPTKTEQSLNAEKHAKRIHDRSHVEIASRRERELHQKRLLISQHVSDVDIESKRQETMMLSRLQNKSQVEMGVGLDMWRTQQTEKIMTNNNNLLAEQKRTTLQLQHQAQLDREYQFKLQLLKDKEIEAQCQIERYVEIQLTQENHNHDQRLRYCREVAESIVDVAMKSIAYREVSGNELIPKNLWKEWMLLFVNRNVHQDCESDSDDDQDTYTPKGVSKGSVSDASNYQHLLSLKAEWLTVTDQALLNAISSLNEPVADKPVSTTAAREERKKTKAAPNQVNNVALTFPTNIADVANDVVSVNIPSHYVSGLKNLTQDDLSAAQDSMNCEIHSQLSVLNESNSDDENTHTQVSSADLLDNEAFNDYVTGTGSWSSPTPEPNQDGNLTIVAQSNYGGLPLPSVLVDNSHIDAYNGNSTASELNTAVVTPKNKKNTRTGSTPAAVTLANPLVSQEEAATVVSTPVYSNPLLNMLSQKLANVAAQREKVDVPVVISSEVIGIIMTGKPFAGKRTQSDIMVERFGLKLLSIDSLIADAVQEAQRVDPNTFNPRNLNKLAQAAGLSLNNSNRCGSGSSGSSVSSSNANNSNSIYSKPSMPIEACQLEQQLLGYRISKYLAKGESLPEDLCISLIVNAIQFVRTHRAIEDTKGEDSAFNKAFVLGESSAPRGLGGWLLTGFPNTFSEAKALEKALSGYELPRNKRNQLTAANKRELNSSRLGSSNKQLTINEAVNNYIHDCNGVQPPYALFPGESVLKSGVDLFLEVDVNNDVCLERALNRKANLKHGALYDIETSTPLPHAQEISELNELPEDVDVIDKLPESFIAYEATQPIMQSWYSSFGIHSKVDGNLSHEKIRECIDETVINIIQKKLRSKTDEIKAADEAKVKQEAHGAQLNARGNWVNSNNANTTSLASTQPISKTTVASEKGDKADKGDKGDKGDKADKEKVNASQVLLSRLPMILSYIESKPDSAITAESQSLDRSISDTYNWTLFKDHMLSLLLSHASIYTDSTYTTRVKQLFRALRHERKHTMEHLTQIKQNFSVFLRRPDSKNSLIEAFQDSFNSVPVDLRRDNSAKEELLLRTDELGEALFGIVDKRVEETEAELNNITQSGCIEYRFVALCTIYLCLIQLELDRYNSSCNIVSQFYTCVRDISANFTHVTPIVSTKSLAGVLNATTSTTAAGAISNINSITSTLGSVERVNTLIPVLQSLFELQDKSSKKQTNTTTTTGTHKQNSKQSASTLTTANKQFISFLSNNNMTSASSASASSAANKLEKRVDVKKPVSTSQHTAKVVAIPSLLPDATLSSVQSVLTESIEFVMAQTHLPVDVVSAYTNQDTLEKGKKKKDTNLVGGNRNPKFDVTVDNEGIDNAIKTTITPESLTKTNVLENPTIDIAKFQTKYDAEDDAPVFNLSLTNNVLASALSGEPVSTPVTLSNTVIDVDNDLSKFESLKSNSYEHQLASIIMIENAILKTRLQNIYTCAMMEIESLMKYTQTNIWSALDSMMSECIKSEHESVEVLLKHVRSCVYNHRDLTHVIKSDGGSVFSLKNQVHPKAIVNVHPNIVVQPPFAL